MEKALVALDSTACSGKSFDHFAEAITRFQQQGIIPAHVDIASIYHSAMSPLPYEFYSSEKFRLAKEAEATIKHAANGRLGFDSVHVLLSNSPEAEDHVARLSKHAKRQGNGFLVLASNDRAGLPYWLLGSFSETAALKATVPVLVIKPSLSGLGLSPRPRFVFGVDIAAPPTEKEINWVGQLAVTANAALDLIYVIPRYRPVIDSFQLRRCRADAKLTLQELTEKLRTLGAEASFSILDEDVSISQDICDFAEASKSWLVLTTTPARSRARKLCLGSRARQILGMTKRPFLSVRLA